MKTITIFVLCSLVLLRANAQLSPQLASYSGYINAKVYVATKAANLSPAKQLELAKYFYRNDSLAKVWVAQNVAPKQIEDLYLQEDAGLQILLSPTQFAKYMAKTASGYSVLLHAVKLQDTLKLGPPTISALMKSYNQGLSLKQNKGFAQRDWETEQVAKVLSVSQLTTFLLLKGRKAFNAQASEKWHQLVALQQAGGVDSNAFKNEVVGFLEKRVLAKALLKGEKTKKRNDSLEKELYLQKPFILRKLELLSGESIVKSQFVDIIAKREMLKLKPSQVDSLVQRVFNLVQLAQAYQKRYKASKYPTKTYEQQGMANILSPGQVSTWLAQKYKGQATDNAIATLDEVKRRKIKLDKDVKTEFKELYAYHATKLIAIERNKIFKNRETVRQRALAEANKPVLLAKLDAAKTEQESIEKSKKTMAW